MFCFFVVSNDESLKVTSQKKSVIVLFSVETSEREENIVFVAPL